MRFFLAPYTVRIDNRRVTNSRKDKRPTYCKLSGFDGCHDFYKDLIGFFKEIQSNTLNRTYKKYMKSMKVEKDGRIISGIVESGAYGRTSNIRDVETDDLTYKKRSEDADVLPFYFLFYIPEDKNEGILLLQRTGNFGIRTSVGNFLEPYFRKRHKGYGVELNALIREELTKQALRSGSIKKLRCVKYCAPLDRIDGLDEGHKEISSNMEIVLSANRIPVVGRIQKLFEPKSGISVKNLVEIRDFDFKYDTVKVEVEVEGSTRTFDLGKLQKTRTYYDITDFIKLGSDEQPIFESIDKEAKVFLNELVEEMYS